MSNTTKTNQKEQKETTKESGLSSTIMDQSQSTTQHINPLKCPIQQKQTKKNKKKPPKKVGYPQP